MGESEKSGEETYKIDSPCHLFNQFVNACFKCFGGEEDEDEDDDDDGLSTTLAFAHTNSPSQSQSETAMKTSEADFVVESRAIRVRKKPQKPPVGSGGGGQIN